MEVESDNKSIDDCDQVNWKHGYEEEYFWISGIFLVIVGTSGLVSGNTFTMVIFCQQKMRHPPILQSTILIHRPAGILSSS